MKFKYKAEEEGTNKFRISKFKVFWVQVQCDKPILVQVHGLKVIVNQLRIARIELPETFKVGIIITNLPISLKGYRKKILHNSKEFSLEEVQNYHQTEYELRERDKNKNSYNDNNKAMLVINPQINPKFG